MADLLFRLDDSSWVFVPIPVAIETHSSGPAAVIVRGVPKEVDHHRVALALTECATVRPTDMNGGPWCCQWRDIEAAMKSGGTLCLSPVPER